MKTGFLSGIRQDLRYAMRVMRRERMYAAVAIAAAG